VFGGELNRMNWHDDMAITLVPKGELPQAKNAAGYV